MKIRDIQVVEYAFQQSVYNAPFMQMPLITAKRVSADQSFESR